MYIGIRYMYVCSNYNDTRCRSLIIDSTVEERRAIMIEGVRRGVEMGRVVERTVTRT